MIVFYLAAAILTLVAIAIVVVPLLKKIDVDEANDLRLNNNVNAASDRLKYLQREFDSGNIDENEYQNARSDIEKNLALDIEKADADRIQSNSSSPIMAMVVALAIPLLAGYLYLTLGTPDAIDGVETMDTAAVQQQQPQQEPSASDIDAMVTGLAKRLNESEPDNLEGWYRLAQSYLVLGRYDEAIDAAKRVRELSDDDPAALLLHASAISGTRDGAIDNEVEELVMAVIQQQPDNPQALWMAGMAARQRDQPMIAVEYWNRLMPLLDSQPEQQQELKQLITITESEISGTKPDASVAAEQTTESDQDETSSAVTSPVVDSNDADAGAVQARLAVNVSLDPKLAASADPDDTVFIFARALEGPPMPLAVIRKKVSDLPVDVELDDSNAMLPAMTLSKFEQVLVGARISSSGDPIGQTGDLEGSASPIDTNAEKIVRVVIDTVRP